MRLKELRKERKLTQCNLASFLNVAESTYRGYENGTSEPTIQTLCKIADYFNVPLDYLCDRKWDNKSYIEVWKLTDEQKANLYLIEQLNKSNNLIANGYLLRLLQEQKANG